MIISSHNLDSPSASLSAEDTSRWHPGAQKLLVYWESKRQGDRLPARSDIDPPEVIDLLPTIFLADIVDDGGKPRVRFRLIGTEIVERFGYDMTGLWMDEAYTKVTFAQIWPLYQALFVSGAPQYGRLDDRYVNKQTMSYGRLICRLAQDGRTIDAVVGFIGVDKI